MYVGHIEHAYYSEWTNKMEYILKLFFNVLGYKSS